AALGSIGTYLATPLGGQLLARVEARGDLDALGIQATATVDDPSFHGVDAERLRARADLRALGGPPAARQMHLEAGQLWRREWGAESGASRRIGCAPARAGSTLSGPTSTGGGQVRRTAPRSCSPPPASRGG